MCYLNRSIQFVIDRRASGPHHDAIPPAISKPLQPRGSAGGKRACLPLGADIAAEIAVEIAIEAVKTGVLGAAERLGSATTRRAVNHIC